MPVAYTFLAVMHNGKSHKFGILELLPKRIVPKGARSGGFEGSMQHSEPLLAIVYYVL
jgi:hypothetical protein